MAITPLLIPDRFYGQPIPVAPDMNQVVDKVDELVAAVNAGLATSNGIVGGDKYVRYSSSQTYGVPADALTLDRLDPATILPGVEATVINPHPTPLTATAPSKYYRATIVPAGTADAVLVPAFMGSADRVPIAWVEVVSNDTFTPLLASELNPGKAAYAGLDLRPLLIALANGVGTGSTTVVTTPAPGQVVAGPTVTGFLPPSAAVGASVTLTGTGFTKLTAVLFNGTPASFQPINATTVVAVVPVGATTGQMAVTNNAGTGTSTASFTVSAGSTTPTPSPDLTAALAISVATLTLGASVSYSVTPAKGTAPYFYEVVATDTSTGQQFTLGTSKSGSWVPTAVGSYAIEATVSDSSSPAQVAQSATRYLQVVQAANRIPVADAGQDLTIQLPTAWVALMGTASDPDAGDTLTYAWRQVTGPNTATGLPATTLNVVVSGLVAGTYQFGFRSTDNHGAQSTEDYVLLTVQAAVTPPGSTPVTFNLADGDFFNNARNVARAGSTWRNPYARVKFNATAAGNGSLVGFGYNYPVQVYIQKNGANYATLNDTAQNQRRTLNFYIDGPGVYTFFIGQQSSSGGASDTGDVSFSTIESVTFDGSVGATKMPVTLASKLVIIRGDSISVAGYSNNPIRYGLGVLLQPLLTGGDTDVLTLGYGGKRGYLQMADGSSRSVLLSEVAAVCALYTSVRWYDCCGVNDAQSNNIPAATWAQATRDGLVYLHSNIPNLVKVYWASPTPVANTAAVGPSGDAYSAFQAIVSPTIAALGVSWLQYVDGSQLGINGSQGPSAGQTVDGTHPNDSTYIVYAQRVADVLNGATTPTTPAGPAAPTGNIKTDYRVVYSLRGVYPRSYYNGSITTLAKSTNFADRVNIGMVGTTTAYDFAAHNNAVAAGYDLLCGVFDQTGNGRHAVQTDAAKCPSSTLHYDGSFYGIRCKRGQYLRFEGSFTGSEVRSTFVVYRNLVTTGSYISQAFGQTGSGVLGHSAGIQTRNVAPVGSPFFNNNGENLGDGALPTTNILLAGFTYDEQQIGTLRRNGQLVESKPLVLASEGIGYIGNPDTTYDSDTVLYEAIDCVTVNEAQTLQIEKDEIGQYNLTSKFVFQESQTNVITYVGQWDIYSIDYALGDNDQFRFTSANGNYWEYTMPAGYDRLTLRGIVNPDGGTADVTVNGQPAGTINQYSATGTDGVYISLHGLVGGEVIRVTKTGGNVLFNDQYELTA